MDLFGYLKHVYTNVIIVTILSVVAPLLFNMFTTGNLISLILSLLFTLIWTSFVIVFIGCKKEDLIRSNWKGKSIWMKL